MDIKKDIMWRVHLCFLIMIAMGAVVLGRAIYIQRVQGSYWKSMSNKQHLKYMDINAERGTIYSEDGNMLSTSLPVFDIYVDFDADGLREKEGKRFYKHLDSLSISLASLFKDASASAYKKLLLTQYKKRTRYFSLKKKISFEDYKKLRDFPLVREGRNKSGFIVEVKDNRINPYVLLANRTIGLSRGDTSRNVGLERSYDSVLKGQTGQRLMRYVAGAYVPVDGAEIEPENGKDIVTTIDTYIQDVAENALLKMMEQNASIHGSCIVMEVKTGKIKAIANLGKRPDGSYWEDYNYGLGMRTEPGSVFKIATLISLLEDNYVDTGTIVDCEGGQKNFYGLRITDSHLGTGKITVKQAFAISSNVAFAKMADEYYHNQPQKFYDHLHALRLDTTSGIDIVGAAKPFIKKPTSKYWAKTTIPFMAHGYEELETPLNLLMVYNAIANNGTMMKPYLVNSINEMGEEIQSFKPEVLVNKICSDATLGKLKSCLLGVVQNPHGTAHDLENSQYEFAGKTGTAVTAMDNRGYNKSAKIYQSAFIGYFPVNNPEYSIAVVIQNSSESKHVYGASVAGPVFKDVADRLYATRVAQKNFDQMLIPPDNGTYQFYGMKKDLNTILDVFKYKEIDSATTSGNWRNTILRDGNAKLLADNISLKSEKVPDVTGMGLKDALYVLENMGLKVSASGRGKVIYQSLAQNTEFKKGSTDKITIELMASLQQILYEVNIHSVVGSTGIEINDLQIDSRKVKPGTCFIAVKGTLSDGHDFIETAITNGAVAIVCENIPAILNENIHYIVVENSAKASGIMAHNFYGRVTEKITLIGVTGTNGKTTIATLLFKLFSSLGFKSGLISTVQNQIGGKIIAATHTTPDAVSLNQLLANMYEEGCSHVFMEVSSHAIHQHRVEGLQFAGGIFSNITHDHLDYHKTFDEYIRVKKSFFDSLPSNAFALSNADDKRGSVMLQNTKAKKYLYSLKVLADFKGRIIEDSLLGLELMINDVEVHFRLIGTFNAYNLLAVYGAAVCMGENKEKVLQVLSNTTGAEGRFDYMVSLKEKIVSIVDYAHTPDALLNVLATIKNLRQGQQKIITVVGCGGNRDRTKRPEMAEVACEYSDKIIFTSDNPRNEDPEEIIKEMEKGVPITARKKCISITDRKEAIKTAITLAQKEDIILVAGKGHEKYQEINGVKNHFDDKEVVAEMFQLLGK